MNYDFARAIQRSIEASALLVLVVMLFWIAMVK
jgi:hypothetical protein